MRIQPLIMVGGESSRFGGKHKALHPWHGASLVEHVINAARLALSPEELWASIAWLGARPSVDEHLQELGVVFLEDAEGVRGPAAGMLSGARHAAGVGVDWLLVLACDMPATRPALLFEMAQRAQAAPPEVSALIPCVRDPEGDPRLEPLHALYRPAPLAHALEQAAEAGIFKLQRILRDLAGAQFLDEAALEALDPAWRASLAGANTPEELDRLDALLAGA